MYDRQVVVLGRHHGGRLVLSLHVVWLTSPDVLALVHKNHRHAPYHTRTTRRSFDSGILPSANLESESDITVSQFTWCKMMYSVEMLYTTFVSITDILLSMRHWSVSNVVFEANAVSGFLNSLFWKFSIYWHFIKNEPVFIHVFAASTVFSFSFCLLPWILITNMFIMTKSKILLNE